MKEFDIIIVGGGASGCICALTAARHNKRILIIDRQAVLGKKIMVTGNGRCNLTNTNAHNSQNFYNQNIDKFLKIFSPVQVVNFFEEMGLLCYADEEGRVYPVSNSAKSVVDVINNQISKYKNINLSLNTEFQDLNFSKNQYIVKTDKGEFVSKKVVIATGGKSAEIVLKKFNIKTKPFIESLVALKTQSTKSVEGIRLSPVEIKLLIKNKAYFDKGEILFKDSGISGIVAFNISSYLARSGQYNGEIFIDLLPEYHFEELTKLLEKRCSLDLPINKMFDGIFLPQVAYMILNKCKINENRSTAQLKDYELHSIAKVIKEFPFIVKSHYNNNQVYSGGVLLSSLTDNLESKNQKGLYFCGEICDVDGICGGYNLQWAWTSGNIVGEAL